MPSTDDPAPFPPSLGGLTGYLLSRTFRYAQARGREAVPAGRHPKEGAILAALRERGPISQRALGDLLGINRTIMVKVIDSMEAAGLVRRERDPADRRSYAVTPTAEGLATLSELTESVRQGEAAFTANLTPAERAWLNELLSRLLPDTAAPPAPLLQSTGYLVANTHVRLREEGRQALKHLGIEARDFGLLSTLADLQPCSQQQLAEGVGVTGPAIVGIIDALQQAGLVDRTRNPDDRRAHVLRLSPKGQALLDEARPAIAGIQASVTDRLGEDGVTELNTLLTKLLGSPP